MVLTAKLQHYFSWCIWFCHHASCGQSCCVIGFHDVPFTSFLCHAMYIRVVMSWAFMPCHRSHAVLWSAMLSLTCMLSQRGRPCCHWHVCCHNVDSHALWWAFVLCHVMPVCAVFLCHVGVLLFHGPSCCHVRHFRHGIHAMSCEHSCILIMDIHAVTGTFMLWHGYPCCHGC